MDIETIFKEKEIKYTAVRALIFKEFLTTKQALSLLMLEDRLHTIDKSTIFRTLTLFTQKHLIHTIDDGSRSIKYMICGNNCCLEMKDLHPHFYCEKCKETSCLKLTKISKIELPEKYILSSINIVIKGICNNCNK